MPKMRAPLGKAVIGGLLVETATTLFFVPVMFSYLRQKENPYLHARPVPYVPPEHQAVEKEDDL